MLICEYPFQPTPCVLQFNLEVAVAFQFELIFWIAFVRYEGDETGPSQPTTTPSTSAVLTAEDVVPDDNSGKIKIEPQASVVPTSLTEPESQVFGDTAHSGSNNNSNNYNNHNSFGEYKDEAEEQAVITTEQGFTGTVGIKEDG